MTDPSEQAQARDRYAFGKNWSRYLKRSFDEGRVEIARQHFLSHLGRADLCGLDVLDVGCGSGIHSLAALRAGAERVFSFDFDADAVRATRWLHRYAGSPRAWEVAQGDVLDEAFMASLGQWKLVYAWGVLHHTGDVWRALRIVKKAVADGGLLYVSLYSADVQSDPQYWLRVKREYNEAGRFKRWRMLMWYLWEHMMYRRIGNLPALVRRAASYRFERGMSLLTDARDWLGGWPMQFVRDQEVLDAVQAENAFRLVKMVTGQACTEFLFERLPGRAAAN